MKQIKSVALFYRDGSSDKEYNACIEETPGGYLVNFAYGRRGNANTAGTKTSSPVSLAEAEKIYNKLVKEKQGKGYVADGAGTPFSGAATANESTGLIPQLLNPINEDDIEQYIKSEGWMLQEKLDGKRIIAQVKNGGEVITSNRKGLTCGVPKEIADDLARLIPCVLDGEMIGSVYYVFDVLEANGVDIRYWECKRRFAFLTELLEGANYSNLALVPCAFTETEKRALFNALKHKEGVVVKQIYSKYVSGRPASGGNQLKCKFWSSCSAQVINVNAKRSIQVGVLDNGKLVNVGNVTVPPNYDLPSIGDIVEVKYLYFYVNGSLYQPQFLGVRDDVDVDEISTLKPKATDTDED